MILTNACKISRLCYENIKSLVDFRCEVTLSFLKMDFESEELARNRSKTGRSNKLSMHKPYHGEHGQLIAKSKDSRRLRCKQCHSHIV